ncbi:MAG: GH12 family glycosyl hydrolase domain-containing protein [Bacteroidota bacterium]
MQRRLGKALVVLLVLAAFVCAGCGRSAQKDAGNMPNETTRSLVQISDPNGSVNVMGGEYRVYNNVWGASTPQTIQVETSNTYFKVLSTGHNQSGGAPAAYPFILKGSHFGGTPTSPNNPMPVPVPNVNSAPSTFNISTAGANGIWNAAYDIWFVQGGTNKLEMMIWINYLGGCQPAGTKRTTASINGYSWDVYYNGSSVLSYKITSVRNSISIDIKNFMNDAVSRGWLNTAWSLGAIEAGFEIWTNGAGLTCNSFSASVNPPGGTTPTPSPVPTSTPSGSNLALNKPVTASSVEKAGVEAYKAVDGNTTTRWSSAFSDPQWIYVDLGSSYNVNHVILRWEQAYGKSYQIQVSPDASTWTTAYSTTTGDGGVDDITFTARNGRYVRMYGTARGTSYGYSLYEFEVYGSGGAATPTPLPTATPTPTPTGGSTVRYEGENATGCNQVDTWPSGYSGTGIGVKYPGSAMTWSKNFAGGTYTYLVRCNDYSGTQTFYIQLDGVDKGGPYTMTAGNKTWKTFNGSFGNVSAGTHTMGLRVPGQGSANVFCDYMDVTGP